MDAGTPLRAEFAGETRQPEQEPPVAHDFSASSDPQGHEIKTHLSALESQRQAPQPAGVTEYVPDGPSVPAMKTETFTEREKTIREMKQRLKNHQGHKRSQ